MKLIALGANLPSRFGTPEETLAAALTALSDRGLSVVRASRIWLTAPVPFDESQPWYHNAVAAIETAMTPHDLLSLLLSVEQDFGRVRTIRNAPRILDLDLIAYDDDIIADGPDLIVPHPRMEDRAFVLYPLQDIAPDWTNPVSGKKLSDLIQALPEDQDAIPLEKDPA